MNRRKILQLLGSGALMVTVAHKALAQGGHQGHGYHSGHGAMAPNKMGHSGHGSMPTMSHDLADLMPLDKMASKQPLQPLKLLKNTSSKQGVFIANLEAKPIKVNLADDKETEVWAYNGQLPGPQIVVYEGDTVEIHFKNSLSQPTTVHWHGLPVPPQEDGNPQDAVKPGESRIYRFTLPQNCAGTYWYHPHPHGYVSEQVAKGLAGSFIVKAKNDPLNDLSEQHWLISDLRLDKNGNIPENNILDWMNGREGQFVLINGQLQPSINIKTGERIRIWNACSARYLLLAIPGCKWITVGSDGGLLEEPKPAASKLFIGPAERVEVILQADESQLTQLVSNYYDRSKMMVNDPKNDVLLANISVDATPFKLPETLRTIDDLGPVAAKKYVEFSEAEMPTDFMNSNSDKQMAVLKTMFLVNGKTHDMNRIDMTSKLNAIEEWEVYNNSHMDHPFHIHGGQVLITKRVFKDKVTEETRKIWKDTFNVKPYERVTFRIKQTEKGIRMFHCHILEHETLGMMANLNVI
ncbi:multicopper oxidase family protein [Bartonella sp. HY329]|uniref:multicopper oxidase family protein n=1 Tax=unclassified Bartonella TaxID=2645622 RepID=UPI0021CABCB9|nr:MULTISPECIES: multicopper oxidase family protein [unclassified Bartonella]UXM95090.1 multicopper oxidase family protein [Bartonella sp. HY329]UXN09413.1 multicopper oxidase family protein [Bartonella sp. HY328]